LKALFISAVVFLTAVCKAASPEGGTNVFESPTPPAPQSELDRIVFERLERSDIKPVLCSDAVFVRRAFLDVIGTLPTAKEAQEFILDADTAGKRVALVDRLLARPEFADYWAMKWGDVLRIKAEFPINLWPNAAQAYHRWVRASIAENKPYDQFARELLTSSGSNFRVGPVNFYRAIQHRTPVGIAGAVALTFMGTRVEVWPKERLDGMAAFFSQMGYKPTGEWKEEHVFWDRLGTSVTAGNSAPGRASVAAVGQASNSPPHGSLVAWTNPIPTQGVFPDEAVAVLSPDRDPREVFADWLITPKNPWFTRTIVNRIWSWVMGHGIIHPPDDIRDDNPPAHPEVLAYLEKQMIDGGFDMKRIYRLILTSQVYQLSPVSPSRQPTQEASVVRYCMRRLDAEVLSDAINKVTGSTDLYTSPIPEPFTYIPKGMPAVAIGDGSITSPFLALFGRSARATGMQDERNNKPTPSQWLYLLNSSDVQRKLEQGSRLQAIIGFGRKPTAQITEELYLTMLSRYPTPAELELAANYEIPEPAKPAPGATPPSTSAPAAKVAATNAPATNANVSKPIRRDRHGPIGSLGTKGPATATGAPAKTTAEWIDIAWSLINSDEFIYRH
jgi:hypothetical protein